MSIHFFSFRCVRSTFTLDGSWLIFFTINVTFWGFAHKNREMSARQLKKFSRVVVDESTSNEEEVTTLQKPQQKKKRFSKSTSAASGDVDLPKERAPQQKRKESNKKSAHQCGPKNSKGDDESEALLDELVERNSVLREQLSANITDGEMDSASLMTVCDPNWLDARQERVRSFGAESVEDVSVPRNSNHRPPTFRKNLFATPNPRLWPPYKHSGLELIVLQRETSVVHTVYQLVASSTEYRQAQKLLDDDLSESLGNVETLLRSSLTQFPYHIPTLLALHNAFSTTNDVALAQMMLDKAMYSLGVVLARFPLAQSSTRRSLPWNTPANQIVFKLLHLAVHSALKKGCAKTAHELCKLTLSLDPSVDAMGTTLLLDYTALRCREWHFLVLLHYRCTKEETAAPHIHFSAALAQFLLEASHRDNGVKGNRRKLTDDDSRLLREVGTSSEILRHAVKRFPSAAWHLAQAMEEDVEAPPYLLLPKMLDDHVAELFAVRAKDMWKGREHCNLLRAACQYVVEEGKFLDERYHSLTLKLRGLRKEVLLGEQAGGHIPRELLDQVEAPRQHVEMVLQSDMVLLERFEATFGPLPAELRVVARLQQYNQMLQPYLDAIGAERSAMTLFFETLLPWNDIREMALQRAMRERGVLDPNDRRNRQHVEQLRRQLEDDDVG